jgi:hypothetical protein
MYFAGLNYSVQSLLVDPTSVAANIRCKPNIMLFTEVNRFRFIFHFSVVYNLENAPRVPVGYRAGQGPLLSVTLNVSYSFFLSFF